MSAKYLLDLLAHDAVDAALGLALTEELDYGAAADTRLMLTAAVEGLVVAKLPGYCRHTHIDPLANARLLCCMEIVGKRLWTAAEETKSLAHFEATHDVATLLDLWVRARRKYREREKQEVIDRLDLVPTK